MDMDKGHELDCYNKFAEQFNSLAEKMENANIDVSLLVNTIKAKEDVERLYLIRLLKSSTIFSTIISELNNNE